MPAAKQQVSEDFLTSLRNATAQQHKQLENTELSKKLLSDDVTIEDYKNYLLKMRNVIAYCEQEIFPLIQHIIPDFQSRVKLPFIEHDIAALQINEPAGDSFQPIKKVTGTPYALGFMYVVEGSTLGGRVILKHLKNRLGITDTERGTFFAGYKHNTGDLWKKFLQLMSLYATQQNCGNEITEGARDAFTSIYNYFSNTR